MHWPSTIFAAILLSLGLLLALHERRSHQAADDDPTAKHFYERRRRRRYRTALLIAALGLLLGAGQWIDHGRHPILFIVHWLAAGMLALWLLWLAMLDYLATRMHWVVQTRRNLVDIAKARAELTALQASQRNGRGPASHREGQE